jgi:hypothetical protein
MRRLLKLIVTVFTIVGVLVVAGVIGVVVFACRGGKTAGE